VATTLIVVNDEVPIDSTWIAATSPIVAQFASALA